MRIRPLIVLLSFLPIAARADVKTGGAQAVAPVVPQVAPVGAPSLGLGMGQLNLAPALPGGASLGGSLGLPKSAPAAKSPLGAAAVSPVSPSAVSKSPLAATAVSQAAPLAVSPSVAQAVSPKSAPAATVVSGAAPSVVSPAVARSVSPAGSAAQGRAPAAVSSEDSLGKVRGQPNALGRRFKELKAFFGAKGDAEVSGRAGKLGELLGPRQSLDRQVEAMAAELGHKTETLKIVEHNGRLLLGRIAEHMRKGRSDPAGARIRTSADEPAPPVVDRTLRVGVYPVAGDPLQWGHMLIALKAMAELQLDKVVFVFAGDDPRKPNMTPADFRHPMNKALLEEFSPLFAYSSIAVGTDFDGETNIMRMLQLNPEQSIHSFYIVGGDHYNLKDKKGNDDTLLKIQKKLETPGTINPAKHKVSLAFIERDEPLKPIPTPLDVHILAEVGFPASSTLVRGGQYDLMPWAAYEYVRENRPGLYGIKAKEEVPH